MSVVSYNPWAEYLSAAPSTVKLDRPAFDANNMLRFAEATSSCCGDAFSQSPWLGSQAKKSPFHIEVRETAPSDTSGYNAHDNNSRASPPSDKTLTATLFGSEAPTFGMNDMEGDGFGRPLPTHGIEEDPDIEEDLPKYTRNPTVLSTVPSTMFPNSAVVPTSELTLSPSAHGLLGGSCGAMTYSRDQRPSSAFTPATNGQGTSHSPRRVPATSVHSGDPPPYPWNEVQAMGTGKTQSRLDTLLSRIGRPWKQRDNTLQTKSIFSAPRRLWRKATTAAASMLPNTNKSVSSAVSGYVGKLWKNATSVLKPSTTARRRLESRHLLHSASPGKSYGGSEDSELDRDNVYRSEYRPSVVTQDLSGGWGWGTY